MEFIHESQRIYMADDAGKLLAEITFPVENGVADINHTFVDASLRGQGVADRLVLAAAQQLRGQGIAARATCTYAVKWFAQHPEQADLLQSSAR